MAFVLPPLGTREGRRAALDFARQSQRRAAHFGERPPRLDAHVHVHAARPARLGPSAKPHFVEKSLHLHRDASNVVPCDPWTRIEIDAKLVGVIHVDGAHRVRMKLDASEVHDPCEPCRVVDHDLLRRAAGGEGERRRPQPGGALLGGALLVEDLPFRAVDEALEHDGTVPNAAERSGRYRQVVADDVELRQLRLLREIGLARVGDAHLPAVDREDLRCLFRRHAAEATSWTWPIRSKTSSTCSASSPSSRSSTKPTPSRSARGRTTAPRSRSPRRGPTSASSRRRSSS